MAGTGLNDCAEIGEQLLNGPALALQAAARTGDTAAHREYYLGRESWALDDIFFEYLETGKDPRDPDAPEPPSIDRIAVMPPGYGKTTKVQDWMLKKITEDRGIRFLIASKAIDRSKMIAMNIAHHLKFNQKIVQDYGGFVGPRWTQAEFEVSGRDPRIDSPTMRAIGTKTDAVGPRCDVLICDDIFDRENTRTPYRRAITHDWLTKVALSRIDPSRGKPWPYGAAIYITNLWHRRDEFSQMIQQGLIEPLIVKAFDHPEREYSTLPEFYSVEALERIEQRDPAAFQQLYMMNLRGMEGAVFDWDWQRHWTKNPDDLDPDDPGVKLLPPINELRKIGGMDLAEGTIKGDFPAMAILGEHPPTGDVFVLWGWQKKVDVHLQLAKLKAVNRMANPERFNIEKNFNAAVSAFAATDPALSSKIYPVTSPSTFTKTERVRLGLQALTSRGQLFFPLHKWYWPGESSFTPRHAEEQFFNFPDVDHDDFVDTVEIARRDPFKRIGHAEIPVLTTKKRNV